MNKKATILIAMMVVVCLLLTGCLIDTSPIYKDEEIAEGDPIELIDRLRISVIEEELKSGEIPEFVKEAHKKSNAVNSTVMYELPDISSYEPLVKGNAPLDVEIFVPEEDNLGISDLVVYAAKKYNEENTTSSITVRLLDSNLAIDFINGGEYNPKGFISPNALYALLLKESGISSNEIYKGLTTNNLGVVISSETYELLKTKYEVVDEQAIVSGCMQGALLIGYTNPMNNLSGLNFIVSLLSYFDANSPLSMEATTDFTVFQGRIPSVAYSFTQTWKAYNEGKFNAFVTTYQEHIMDGNLKDHVFVPFGAENHYTLFSMEGVTDEEANVLKDFANLFEREDIVKKANEEGLGRDDDYISTVIPENYDGLLNDVLSFWKENKSSGKKVAVIFVCDVSGSMVEKPLRALKESAINAMQYISEDSLVGIISYDDHVYYSLPISEFDESQQSFYVGAIQALKAGGGTATNDALLIALQILELEKTKTPDIKPIIFLLSDGQTNSGYSPLSRVSNLISTFDTPVYTIGYDADVKEMEAIAKLNNGIYLNASSEEIGYVLKSLFNAEA